MLFLKFHGYFLNMVLTEPNINDFPLKLTKKVFFLKPFLEFKNIIQTFESLGVFAKIGVLHIRFYCT